MFRIVNELKEKIKKAISPNKLVLQTNESISNFCILCSGGVADGCSRSCNNGCDGGCVAACSDTCDCSCTSNCSQGCYGNN